MLMEGLSAHYDKIRGEILLGFKVKGDIATALYFRPPCAHARGGGGGVKREVQFALLFNFTYLMKNL